MEYRKLSDELKKEFGTKVYKLSLQSGCSCPNRDGKISYGGCSFCSEGGSGDFAAPLLPIDEQITLAKKKVDGKFSKNTPCEERKYIAYFQSYTNTYGDVNALRNIFLQAINHEEIVALSIGTRPDCLSDEMLEMISSLNRIKPVWIELGLQTTNERSAKAFGRGYELPVFENAYMRLKKAGLVVIVHVILGLPGETENDMLATVKYLAALQPALDGIKLQLLHILKGTRLSAQYNAESAIHNESDFAIHTESDSDIQYNAESAIHNESNFAIHNESDSDIQYEAESAIHNESDFAIQYEAESESRLGQPLNSSSEKKSFHVLTLDEYCSIVVKCLKLLPKETVVHRITGDGPKNLLVAPLWSADKKKVLNSLNRAIRES